jgi:hypothetical protein
LLYAIGASISSRPNSAKHPKHGDSDLSKDVMKEVLSTCKTIAFVGLSREPEKDSYQVGVQKAIQEAFLSDAAKQ